MAEDFNCIRATVKPDREALVLQMWIMGEPGSWIEYSPDQLDNFIEFLKIQRLELRPLPSEPLAEIAPGE